MCVMVGVDTYDLNIAGVGVVRAVPETDWMKHWPAGVTDAVEWRQQPIRGGDTNCNQLYTTVHSYSH